VQDHRGLVEVHRFQAELHLERLTDLRSIDPELIIARAQVWAWMRWFWFTTAVSARVAGFFGGSLTGDAKFLGRECSW